MKKDWGKLLIEFMQGLVQLTGEMQGELKTMLETLDVRKDCGRIFARTSQLNKDISKIVDYIDNFCEKEGLRNERMEK